MTRFSLDVCQKGPRTENTASVATYRQYVSKISWFWQDLRAVYQISPANRCLGIHIVKILPGRAPFPVRGLQIMHSKLILPSRFPNQRKSPAPDRLHLHSSEQSAMPPTSYLLKHKKGDPVGSPFNSGTDQKNQLKVIVDDPYLYRSSFSFAAS